MGLPYLGERRDETIACRAALGERFLKGEDRHLAREAKMAPEISRIGSANGRTGFVKGLQRQSRKPKGSAKAVWQFCKIHFSSHLQFPGV
jgi:hypothetical protein